MKNLKKEKNKSNKSFGIVFFIFFLIIALWPLMNDGEIRIWSIILALLFLILGLINSKILTPLHRLWIKLGYFLGYFVSPIIMGMIFVSLAQIGALFESALKRRAGIKDSGTIMPGHGGALDRLDSIVLAFPVLYYFIQ